MKRIALIAIAGAIAMVPVASAGAPAPEYGGKLDKKDNQYFGFNVNGSGANREVAGMQVRNIPVKCRNAPKDKISGTIDGKINVDNDGRFAKTLRDRSDGVNIKQRITGRIKGSKAKGTYKISTNNGRCGSKKLRWRAKSPSPPPPAPQRGTGRLAL